MDKNILRENYEGIIALSGCLGGELCRSLRRKDYNHAEEVIKEYQDIFGSENYFLEIMHHPGIEGFEDVKRGIVTLGQKMGIPLVRTQDSHYLLREDARPHDTLLAIQTNSDLQNEDRFSMLDDDYSFINGDTAKEYFKDAPGAVENTMKIAEMCDIEIPLGGWTFPDLKIESGITYDDELSRLAYEGVARRGLSLTTEVEDRIKYELKIIKDKGYGPYFLVVADLSRLRCKNGIYTNIRGSVAGSLVTYLIGITKVNPLEYKLPFERFLNPERPSAPDIDMDFADNRRDEMIGYVRQKYGENHVAQIGTFGTMMARGAVRDVARALGHPYALGDQISKLIPMGSQGFPMTIKHAFELIPELPELIKMILR